MSDTLSIQPNESTKKKNLIKKSGKNANASDTLDNTALSNPNQGTSQDKEPTSNEKNTSSKIKYLPPSVLKDIEQKNVARKLAGLQPIRITIRPCLTCGSKFQSAGNRTCGCASRSAGIIAGREII